MQMSAFLTCPNVSSIMKTGCDPSLLCSVTFDSAAEGYRIHFDYG
jgi:hypothetical protein